MKSKIVSLVTAIIFVISFSACSGTRHQKDDLHNNKTSANQRMESDHILDNQPR